MSSTALALLTNQLVPVNDPKDVAVEALYKALAKKVEALTARNTVLVDSINRVISLIRDKHCSELDQMYEAVARELDEAAVGLETSAPVTEARDAKEEAVQLSDRSVRDHCRKLWRKLAPKLHPDRGGSAELFDMARQAYKANDLHTLIAMEREHIDAKNIGWIKLHGIDYLKERIESLDITHQEIMLSPFMTAYRLWLSGVKGEAIDLVSKIIRTQIQAMRQQIAEMNAQRRMESAAKRSKYAATPMGTEDLDELWANAHEVQPPQTDTATTPPYSY